MQAVVTLLFLVLASKGFAQTNPYAGYGVTPPNPAQQCIGDICGSPAQSNLYMTKYLDRLNEYVRLASDPKQIDFPPAIAQTISEIQAGDKKQNEVVLDMFRKSASLGTARPEGFSKAFYNILYASPHLKKLKYKTSTVNGKLDVSIDEPATLSALADLSEADRNWILRVGKYFLASYSSGSLSDNEVQSKPPALLLRQLYPNSSIAEAMKTELAAAQTSAASLKDLSPMEKALYFNNTSPERIALIATHVANGTVDENETREIIRWNIEFKRNKSYFRNSDSPLMSREAPPVEEIIKQAGGAEAVARSFEQERLKDRQKDEGKIQSCKMQFFINKGLLPSKEQVDTLNQDIKRSKEMVIETIKAKFPPSMHQRLIKSVEDADFINPPTAADFERNFGNALRQKLESQRTNAAALANVPTSDIRQLIAVFSLSKATQDPSESKDDSNAYCDAFKYSPMSDANYTTYGSILLGFSTATGDETSRLKTIMHELGHSVSRAIAESPQDSERLFSVRKCLADQHTEEMPPQMKQSFDEVRKANPKADGPYVEEDFADTVAGESGKDVKGRNAWCQFLSLSYDRQQYSESTLQAADGDTHSSSLFRLLNFEMMKKRNVPDSCKSYYKVAQFSEHFSSCFDLANPRESSQSQPARGVR